MKLVFISIEGEILLRGTVQLRNYNLNLCYKMLWNNE